MLRKLMLLAAVLAVALMAAAPALAQSPPQVVADAKAKTATAGAAKADANCDDGIIDSKAGGVEAKAPCTPPPPPAKAELPKTGGASAASLFALGAGALLVGGGLLARRIMK